MVIEARKIYGAPFNPEGLGEGKSNTSGSETGKENSMDNRYVIGLGEILWDCFGESRRLGGAPANCAYHMAQFGHRGMVVSAVGRDADGDAIVEKKRLPHLLPRVDYPTGTVNVDISDANDPKYVIHTAVAWSHIPFTEEIKAIAAETKAVCFGTLAQWNAESRDTIQHFLDATPADCLKVFDVNLRQSYYTREVLDASFTRCDILKINEAELQVIARLYDIDAWDPQRTCRELMQRFNVPTLVLTMGTRGSEVYGDGARSFLETPSVRVKSAVGAGDAFTGAFVGCLLNGASMYKAHQAAVSVAAYICTREGAMPRIPNNLIM